MQLPSKYSSMRVTQINLAGGYFLCALLWTLLAGCGNQPNTAANVDSANTPQELTLMLNWYPEAEHGGFYAAQVHGIFEKYGLQVKIRPGGPNAPVAQELVTGRVQFAIGNADDVLLFRNQSVPVVALMAPIQNTPRCVLVRDDSEVTQLSDLSGMVLQANAGRPFLDYLRSLGMLEGVQVVPYSGSVAKLVSDPKTAIQAYSFSEPFMAQEQGVAVRTLMLSDVGFNPYASCLIANEQFVTDNADVVARMVVACREGWQKYLAAPEETNAVILAANSQGMTAGALQFGAQELQPLCLPSGLADADLGSMTTERWQTLTEQFVKLGLIDSANVNAVAVFTTEFIERAGN